MASIFDIMPRFTYSHDLHKHLKGFDISKCDGYGSGTSIYGYVSIIMIIVSLAMTINFYYGILNRPKFANFWVWLFNMIIAAMIVFCFAFIQPSSDLKHSRYCSDLHFNSIDCMLFGFTAAVYTFIFCMILSLLIKWRSLNNKRIPF